MQQSDTSHNKISFGGVLQPLVESLELNPQNAGRLVGQDVVLHGRSDIQTIIALDSNNDIHLLISPSVKHDSRLSKFDLKGLKITDTEWIVADRPSQIYLDISCLTGKLPLFKRPFLRFAEDVLFEVSESGSTPADAVYKTCFRWRKFWSPDIGAEVTREWVHGLFGELLFLTDLIERFGSNVINSWTGPLGKDHDFQTGADIATEIKTSAGVPYAINCNIRQLDTDLFKKLYIICYLLTPSEDGITLPELVRRVEQLLGKNESMLDRFYELLMGTGYTIQLESAYTEFRLSYSKASVFHIDKDFPKIVEKSFIKPPDHRISGIRYTLQLTGLDELTIDDVASDLKRFKNK